MKEKLIERLPKVLKDNESGGKEQQFKAVEEETKQAGRNTDPKKVEEIQVDVNGTDEDGTGLGRVWRVKPKEDKPPTP